MRHSSAGAGSVLLLLCAMIWGASFVVMKEVIEEFPVCWLLGIRFTTGALLLSAVFHRRLRLLRRPLLRRGAVCGLLLFCAYLTQTWGLAETTPGKNAFLTAVYCVLVPFCAWGITGRRPGRRSVAAAVLCLAGIGLISLNGETGVGRGDALTLVCGVFFALQVTLVGLWSTEEDAVLLTVSQMAAAGVLFLAAAVCTEAPPAHVSQASLWQLAFLILLPTALCNLMQCVGQSMVSPATAGVLLCLESVFGTVFSVLFYGERLSPRVIAGFAMVFAAVLLCQNFSPEKHPDSAPGSVPPGQ